MSLIQDGSFTTSSGIVPALAVVNSFSVDRSERVCHIELFFYITADAYNNGLDPIDKMTVTLLDESVLDESIINEVLGMFSLAESIAVSNDGRLSSWSVANE